jgi:hypothetical protein
MYELPLHFRSGRLFVEQDGELWLLDTGAPCGFGHTGTITFAGGSFSLASDYLGLAAEALSRFTGVRCVGLLGADVLGRFDHILDVPNGTLVVSPDELTHDGHHVELTEFIGIPILDARVGDETCRMFFDTGAQFSYFQGDSLKSFPQSGMVTDFYPGVGRFDTQTLSVPVMIGGVSLPLRCGRLPELLGLTLMMAGTRGIVGNEILMERRVGYFPRRRGMVV